MMIFNCRFMPLDSSFPHHGMFRQTEDDEWQVNLYMLFKKIAQTAGFESHLV